MIKLKRMSFLPVHKTFKTKRCVLFIVPGVFLFIVIYTYFIKNSVSKYQFHSIYHHLKESTNITMSLIEIQSTGKYGFEKVVIEPFTTRKDVIILVLISTSARGDDHRDKRISIRETWGDCQNPEIKSHLYDLAKSDAHENIDIEYDGCRVIFFMGKTYNKKLDEQVKAEADQYGDIIVGDISESYWNITYKLLMGLRWAANQRPKYLLKTDDDVYVHIPRLAEFLYKHPKLPHNLYGGVVYNGDVVRDPNHKHFVLKEDFPDEWYPPFCKGAMYVLSGHILPKLVKASTRMKRFQIDDAYIGVLMRNIGVSPFHIVHFVQSSFLTYFIEMLHYCDLKWIVGIGDRLSPSQMTYIHQQMKGAAYYPKWLCIQLNSLIISATVVFGILIVVFVFIKIKLTSKVPEKNLAHLK